MLKKFLELKPEKPLPQPVLTPATAADSDDWSMEGGILLGGIHRWNPEAMPNPHLLAIGASGSGKTQTLKAIAFELYRTYPDVQIMVIDFHGDQDIEGETCYALHQASPYGINPLKVNLDREGGGPNLQAISVVQVCKRALMLGPNQEGALLSIAKRCYAERGILQDDPRTWRKEPPTFAEVEKIIEAEIEAGSREAVKLKLKLLATVQYGIFSRPQPSFAERLVRLDVSKLPPELGAIAGESLARQVMADHRLRGEITGKRPQTFLVIDEAKEMPATSGSACDRIIADGRKYGLALILASQSERHLSLDVIGNSSTKIVLPVDQTEVKKVAGKFRFAEARVAALRPLVALCRFGMHAAQVEIKPYWQRI